MKILSDSLFVINALTYRMDTSRVNISAVGGVEVALNELTAFPQCKQLQGLRMRGPPQLGTLRCWQEGNLLEAVKNHHQHSVNLCVNAFSAMKQVSHQGIPGEWRL
jgi:hypothetical protein